MPPLASALCGRDKRIGAKAGSWVNCSKVWGPFCKIVKTFQGLRVDYEKVGGLFAKQPYARALQREERKSRVQLLLVAYCLVLMSVEPPLSTTAIVNCHGPTTTFASHPHELHQGVLQVLLQGWRCFIAEDMGYLFLAPNSR